jgi:hypothetical protein
MTLQPQIDQLKETLDGNMTVESTSGWNILRHEILYILWALMDLAILTPLILAFAPWTRFWPPGLVVFLLLLMMLIPFNLSRLMSTLNVRVERQRIVLIFGLILTILIAWRLLLYAPRPVSDLGWISEFFNHIEYPGNPFRVRDLTIFLVVTFMWWRGISLVGRQVDIAEIGFRMRFEILLLFILVAVIAGSLLPWSVTPFILLFFFSSLLAIVITRVEQLELSRIGQPFPITIRWLLFVSGAAAMITFTTGVLAGVLSNDSVTATVGWFSPVWDALGHMGIVVIAIITYLNTPLFIIISWLLGLFIGTFESAIEGGLDSLESLSQAPFSEQLPEELMEATGISIQFPRQLLTILMMLFVVLFVSLALVRLGRSLRRTSSVQYQTANPRPGHGSLPRPRIGQRILDRFGALRRWRAAASIRHLYRQMCATAADYGYPRSESETPYEYLQTLSQAWPDGEEDAKLITEAYVRVHYGELPENREELTGIEAAWKRLESKRPAETEQESEGLSIQRRG